MTEPVLPPLPEIEGVRTWNKRTLDVWAAWQQDFATQLYGPSEIAMAVELAYLHALAVSEKTSSHWAEVRQWADRLMLTPKGKRDARVRLVEAREEAPAQEEAPLAPVIRLVDDAVAS
jgi:hypothetical protein